jgi:two-component system LytT family response regulator
MKALLVEDEALNLAYLRNLLIENFPEVLIVGEASNAADAEILISQQHPDVVFLDVQMPGESGLELLARLPSVDFAVVIVTAYDQYALRAIRMSALDFLLKPVQLDELREAIAKAEQRLAVEFQAAQLALMMDQLKGRNITDKIALPTGGTVRFVTLDEVIYCECRNNATDFYVLNEEKKLIVGRGAYTFDMVLRDQRFIRCHHSFIVNKNHVKALVKADWQLQMVNGNMVPVSRQRREEVKARLALWI